LFSPDVAGEGNTPVSRFFQENLDALFAESPTPLYLARADEGVSVIVWANKTYRSLVGPAVASTSPTAGLRDLLHPSDRERLACGDGTGLRLDDKPIEYRIARPDGRWTWLHDHVVLCFREGTDNGDCLRSIEDITRSKDTAAALSQSEIRYRNLVEGSVAGIVLHKDWVPIFVNQAYATLFGYASPAEVMALGSMKSLFPPEEHARLETVRDARLRGEAVPERYEIQGLRKDGSRIWIEQSVRVVEFDGAPCIQCMVSDITTRKEMEQLLLSTKTDLEEQVANRSRQLDESEARYRDLVEQSLQGIFVHQDFVPLFANRAMADMFGYGSPREILRLPSILELFDRTERERVAGYKRARDRGEPAPATYEARCVKANGEPIWLEVRVGRSLWGGKPSLQVACIDISGRKQAEENLIAATIEADRANRAKSDFLAKMSHELRTPLNAIIGFSEMLRHRVHTSKAEPEPGDRSPEYVGYIHDSALHLLSIVNDILDLSRIEAGEYRLVEEAFSLAETVDTAVDMVRNAVRRKQLQLRIACDSRIRLRADQRAIVQVLLNLLSNATKFTADQGTVSVTVSRAADGTMQIEIEDTGIGIPADRLYDVLRPFGQIRDEPAYRASGTGLGLPIAKSLIEMHGGGIAIASVEGQGTTVTLRLPADRVWWPQKSTAAGDAAQPVEC
jgi:PAS domain S-box-containing protein